MTQHYDSPSADEAERIFTQDALKLLDEMKRQKPTPMPYYPRQEP